MVKSKQLKILRKKMEKVNKAGLDLPPNAWPKNNNKSNAAVTNDDDDNEKENTGHLEDLTLHSWNADHLKKDNDKRRLEEFLSLFETNMGEYYRNSEWGLNLETKTTEFLHARARFLVLLSKEDDDKLAGFCHYRLEYDDEDEPTAVVAYVYELQIVEQFRRKGLGKKLTAIVETLAHSMELPKVMLTVFRANQAAMNFYQGLQYGVDEDSPSQHGQFADYEILSKQV
ncbi:alpha-acetyltransferase 40 [Seminavis robusta]|uniref:N-alpha-acetyltransferase 40 n=1 Tax=Seminavis robusta TaxID=568900 RepID=A0A9N8HH65_9STRA|nr:alpha-acetyltransferase 40 [Seminavis robusta]|eukprot:Sro686_g187040.1 alpha-acetyltransferase 40 (228) ;mRNA; r:13026-13709